MKNSLLENMSADYVKTALAKGMTWQRAVFGHALRNSLIPIATSFGNNVSHANNTTKRRWFPNLQRVRALVNGKPKSLTVCTSCLRAGKVIKNVRSKKVRPAPSENASGPST